MSCSRSIHKRRRLCRPKRSRQDSKGPLFTSSSRISRLNRGRFRPDGAPGQKSSSKKASLPAKPWLPTANLASTRAPTSRRHPLPKPGDRQGKKMHVSRIFIERPVMTGLVTFAILLFGLGGFRALPVAALPSVDYPVLYLSLNSATLPLYTVDEYAETLLAQRISMVSGISRVQVFGAQKYAVRIQVKPDTLAAHGVGIDEVQRAVQQSNVNLPTG